MSIGISNGVPTPERHATLRRDPESFMAYHKIKNEEERESSPGVAHAHVTVAQPSKTGPH